MSLCSLPAFTIFIKCPSGNFALVVNGSSSIQDILEILRQKVSSRQDAYGIFSSPFHLYMPGRWLPLSTMETLDALNMSNLSTLHFRSLLLGGASPVDPVDLTFTLDDSSDHCEYQHCKNRKVNSDPYKFQPGEEKFQMKACLHKDGPATLRNLGTETLTLTTCKSCAALASKKKAASQHTRHLLKKDGVVSSSRQMTPPLVPTIPGIHLLEVADAILKVIASIPNTLSIDESVKKAKAKGAAPELRLPVAISSLLNKNALKTGYLPAHYLYNSEKDKFHKLAVEGQGVLAKVFVQVKRENGTKKGISFHNVQHGVTFPPPTPHTEVMQCVLESLLVLVQAHHKVKGFKFTTDNFFVVDSGWIPVLEGDLMKPTELFYKGITKGLSKKGTPVGGLKYSQGAPENWYMVLNPAAAERYDEWEAGDTPKSSPVKNGKGKKREEPELDSDMDDLSDIDYVSIFSGPPQSTISVNSERSCSSKQALSPAPPMDVPSSKQLCTGIDVSDCTKWFDAILDIIDTGGTYLESSFDPGLPEQAVEICLIPQLISGLLSSPQFTFTSQLRGHIYVDWVESEEQRLRSSSFKTAHFGLLKVGMNLEGVDVPAALQGKVCIKQLYFGLMTRQGVQQMTDDVECMAILQETNTLVWVNAIHDMSIALVHAKVSSYGPPPGPISDLHFVEAAVSLTSCPESVKLKDWRGFCVLVERLLDSDDFVKYVLNGAPELVKDVSEDHLAITTFLCFLQHLQYSQTLGKCFILDYQGAGKWLMDPQVMAKSAYVLQK
ncbi:uncharacterized protein EV420DRAFT_1651417 [Desarmillaria tabescens]|uniref:Alpha-type protein kinase domain-containing protein n=1 Tax=Armillaria tabescens TaxID=1929756 RepID=A0AA39JAR3_ARMTA|nr:uncharacterized protein EV420DRAFT_1651417 [Desarmillaria tabescens]KAK0438492.1 hypothetical protein EV420DRAFT_1651417 [Desarmillaria tabescens]